MLLRGRLPRRAGRQDPGVEAGQRVQGEARRDAEAVDARRTKARNESRKICKVSCFVSARSCATVVARIDMATETLTTMTGEEMIALSKKHTLFEWSAQSKVDPIPVARAKGIYFWTPEGKRFIDFNSQLMCVNIGHGDERVIRAIQEQAAMLAYANPFMATEPRARLGAKLAEITPGRHRRLLLHQRRRRSQRERDQARAAGHRPPQDPGALPLVSRRHGRQHDADRRSAALGRRARACPASSTCSIRITASSAAGTRRSSRWRCSRK